MCVCVCVKLDGISYSKSNLVKNIPRQAAEKLYEQAYLHMQQNVIFNTSSLENKALRVPDKEKVNYIGVNF